MGPHDEKKNKTFDILHFDLLALTTRLNTESLKKFTSITYNVCTIFNLLFDPIFWNDEDMP